MKGSAPFALSNYDFVKIGKGAAIAAAGGAIAALITWLGTDGGELIAKDQIGIAITAIAAIILNAIAKWISDTRTYGTCLAFALIILGFGAVSAEEVAVLVDDSKPGTYLLTVANDGSVSVNPIRVVRPGQSPTTPTDPTPGQPTAFSETVSALTKAALDGGGSPTTAAGLSSVYSLVSSGVKGGSIPEANALSAIKVATDTVLNNVSDKDKWAKWRTDLGTALETLRQQGVLKIPSAFDEVKAGIDSALGKSINPLQIAGYSQSQMEAAEPLFENIDLTKLAELIKLIVTLLEIFKTFKP